MLRGRSEEEGDVAVDVAMVRWRSIRRGVAVTVGTADAADAVEGVDVKSVRQQHARAASGRRDVGRDIAVQYSTVYVSPNFDPICYLVVVGGVLIFGVWWRREISKSRIMPSVAVCT